MAALRDAGEDEDGYSWALQKNLLSFVERNLDRKGHGIWEMRALADYFTHGRAMMYAAFCQGIRAVEDYGRQARSAAGNVCVTGCGRKSSPMAITRS